MSHRVLFIASFGFPNYDAGATRLTMLARALRMKGCHVELCGVGDEVQFDGLICHTLNPGRSNRLFNWLAYRTLGLRSALFVRRHIKEFDSIVVSALPSNAIEFIKSLCLKRGVTLAVDCTEWYTPEEFKGGESDRSYLDHTRLITEVIDSRIKVIAISSYLERYFSNKGCNVLRIPSVLDVKELSSDGQAGRDCGHTRIVYAGSPGKKDSLWLILQAIISLSSEDQERIKFDIYGVDQRSLSAMIPDGMRVPACVRAYGRVPRETILEALHDCDFTVLMRDPSQRFAQAGMPTKVTESLGAGVPVIANITSDLGDYLIDDKTAFVVPDYSAEAFAETLVRALSSSDAMRDEMRRRAYLMASSKLDYRSYAECLSTFLLTEGKGVQ